ncbi:sulfate ABC transporter substrate-binding protein [bacterium]|nr:sulfate ABC transporter substrate-binding protein [bacterium]
MKKFFAFQSTEISFFMLIILLLVLSTGCTKTEQPVTDTLLLGAYTVPKDVYQEQIIPKFQEYWKENTGRDIKIEQSFAGSGAQARAIIGGFEADIAALSLEGDIKKIQEHGLITHDWKNRKGGSIVSRSVVIIGTRKENSPDIEDWDSLISDDIELICPNPKTSGGAKWFINAIYGAELKRTEKLTGVQDPESAKRKLKSVVARIKVMDKGARGSMTTYERGIGNAILAYENEALLRIRNGRDFPYLVPEATILIENPVAVITVNAEKHGVTDAANAFVDFLFTVESQRAFAEYGFRPVNSEVIAEYSEKYPEPALLFDINYLGGWEEVEKTIFGPYGIWNKVTREIRINQ